MYVSEKEAKNVKNLDDAARQAKKLKDETVDYVRSETKEAMTDAKARARDAGRDVAEFFKENGKKLRDVEEKASDKIRANPMASAAAIFASGLVVGALLKGSGRSRREDAR